MSLDERIATIEALGYKREVVTTVRWQNEVSKGLPNGQRRGFVLSEQFLQTASDDEFKHIVAEYQKQSDDYRRKKDIR